MSRNPPRASPRRRRCPQAPGRRQPGPLGGQQPVETRLVLRPEFIGDGRGAFAIARAACARPIQYPARPSEIGVSTAARNAGNGSSARPGASEICQREIARQPFQIGIVAPSTSPCRAASVIGGLGLARPHLRPRQIARRQPAHRSASPSPPPPGSARRIRAMAASVRLFRICRFEKRMGDADPPSRPRACPPRPRLAPPRSSAGLGQRGGVLIDQRQHLPHVPQAPPQRHAQPCLVMRRQQVRHGRRGTRHARPRSRSSVRQASTTPARASPDLPAGDQRAGQASAPRPFAACGHRRKASTVSSPAPAWPARSRRRRRARPGQSG